MIENIKTVTSSISWATLLLTSECGEDARTWVTLLVIRSEIGIRNIEMTFLLLYWWLVFVKLRAVEEQMWERDTHCFKIVIKNVFSRFFFNLFFFFLWFACLEHFIAFSSLVFGKRSFASVLRTFSFHRIRKAISSCLLQISSYSPT